MEAASKPEQYDALIVGSGAAGKFISWSISSTGKRVALVERRWVGGSCPNVACLPSKNVIHSAAIAHDARNSVTSGMLLSSTPQIDMAVVRERKREMVRGLVEMHEGSFKGSGVEFIWGNAKFIAPKTIVVETSDSKTRTLAAETIIISTGSRATIDDTPGLRESDPLTHIEILEMDKIPTHLVILGGGYVGLEFAQAMRRLGSDVSVVERNNRILKHEDEDISSSLTDILKREGIRFYPSTTVSKVTGRSGESIALTGKRSDQPFEITGSHLLVASGRTPNTDGLGLESTGVSLTPKGHVQVDEYLRTTSPGVFAVGDCAGSPHFTHIAIDDFRIVRDFLAGKTPLRSTTNRQVPYTLFTSPELAHVGLSEDAARRDGIPYRLSKLDMKFFLRTRTLGQTEGFAKALISTTDDKILGFTALGAGAGELLTPVQLAMAAGLPYTSLGDLIVTHPTLSEGLADLFSAPPQKI
ncbi:FAD-dependent pyridine nucleotide-disulfide oxidoreductase [Cenococcum geophilum 1.58]|uniref:FAD-dependent pyridine nucleotide-disulfide oxidoreductase n=1 Tax=Cenococcum geophilum 1.58 TaxID=794803 RepID=UPI00358FAE30|nr:FAD-dependent pyridine nucleotide-disulfide oxidoreductase [Cenococcum geophilum 1.58]